jgi:ketosteroid isomerase-like protein
VKKRILTQWIVVSLAVAPLAWWAGVSIREAAAMGNRGSLPALSRDSAAIEAVRQVERDMGDAMVAVDIDKLNQIFADDWATVGTSGRIITKEKVLGDFRSGKDKLVSYENGPIDVQVFGDIAVAHGGVTEKRMRDGKNDSGESVWMDLLEKRAGKWVVVRSASADVKYPPYRPLL